MSTWIAAIVETRGREDFWQLARELDVHARSSSVPPLALIDCEVRRTDLGVSLRLAEALSRRVGGAGLGLFAQTTSDVYAICAFEAGARVRRLDFDLQGGGWLTNEGPAQRWEPDFFFDGSAGEPGAWPDMLDDDLPDDDIERYEAARQRGDPTPVLDLLHPSSTAPLRRMCRALGVDPDAPAGRYRRPSLWRRLLVRRPGAHGR